MVVCPETSRSTLYQFMRFTGIVAGGLALLLIPNVAVAETLEQLVQQGNAALEAKKYAEAEGIWRKVIQSDPNNASGYYKLCDLLDDLNRIVEAETACRKSVQINPSNSRANFLFG